MRDYLFDKKPKNKERRFVLKFLSFTYTYSRRVVKEHEFFTN